MHKMIYKSTEPLPHCQLTHINKPSCTNSTSQATRALGDVYNELKVIHVFKRNANETQCIHAPDVIMKCLYRLE